ncbi:MAG: DEAD/DEAH box helicase family protein, partial [Dehalococcoidia bacterium]|nr:DEAD/DEAH box helicase family protein [Dehalococcoidia bacterium]
DETCHFLAIDFDKQSWTEDTAAFLQTCRLMGVPVALERSRSGHGGHVWVFLTDPVSATKVRQLGCYLLTETMSRHYRLSMDSYDRLFPNQDTLPKGGLGNLISLPLQKTPSAKGNSVFVNDGLEAYKDQWAFLASLGRLRPSTVESLAREAARRGQIIGVGIDTDGEDDRPWNLPPSKRTPEPSLTGLWPESVKVVFSNLLYVEKEGLSSPVLNRIKRMAAFQNPEFYKRQSLRLSTALTPRVISCSKEFPQHLGLPRGCRDGLQELLTCNGARLDLIDDRSPGKEISLVFQGTLSPVQQAAATDLLHHDNGVFVAPAGLGKTAVGAYLIAARGRNTLVLVHRRPLMEQWLVQLSSFLGLDPKAIGQIGGGKDKRTGLIDVAMLQSLSH